MNILEPILIGLDQLRTHKLRASLSILGILLSVGSVTGIVSMGDGLRLPVLSQFERMGGASSVSVRSPNRWYRDKNKNRWVQRDWEEYLTNQDLRYIAEEIVNVRYVIPVIQNNFSASYRKASVNASVWASNEHLDEVQNWIVDKGRFISEADVRNAEKVAVIGSRVATDLFGSENPVGKEIKVEGMRCVVVGVLTGIKFFGDSNE